MANYGQKMWFLALTFTPKGFHCRNEVTSQSSLKIKNKKDLTDEGCLQSYPVLLQQETTALKLHLRFWSSDSTILFLCRKITEPSGNSPRSANKYSSSSFNLVATSLFMQLLFPKQIGLSSTTVDAASLNQPKSLSNVGESSLRSRSTWLVKTVSSSVLAGSSDSVVGDVAVAVVVVVVLVTEEDWLALVVGMGWLWSQTQVTMSIVGFRRLLSTCFLAGHPLELLHR